MARPRFGRPNVIVSFTDLPPVLLEAAGLPGRVLLPAGFIA